jgi:hypothetical protein
MLNRIKNSLVCKCLQVLLIGYFLMSSINIANSFGLIINENAAQNSISGITCNFLKKILKCDAISEELEDSKTKDSKTAKLAKGIPSMDYIIPLDASLHPVDFQIESAGKNYIDNPIFSFGFHGEIHLPPPQIVI